MENSAPITQPIEDELRGGDELTSMEDLKENVTTPPGDDQDGTVSRKSADVIEEEKRLTEEVNEALDEAEFTKPA